MNVGALLASTLSLGGVLFGCGPLSQHEMSASRPASASSISAAPSVVAVEHARDIAPAERPAMDPALPAAVVVREPERQPFADFGRADRNQENDFEIGPPETPPDCYERLRSAGVRFKPAALPLRQTARGSLCGTEQAVVYQGSPAGIRYNSAPVVSCGMALALASFEADLQERAAATYGSRVRSLRHLGTYSCRTMARYPKWVSEHSYANAIDITSFVLESWRTVRVTSYRRSPEASEDSRFLHDVARDAFDHAVFSVVLTPAYDALHHDHFHLDLARYRVDGT